MRLPRSHGKADPSIREMVLMFYGAPGIGKTTLAAGFSQGEARPLFLWTSPVKYVDAYKLAISSWKDFKRAVQLLERSKPSRYSAIVIDVVDDVYTHCRKEVLESRGVEHEADLDWGKGWDLVMTEFTRWVAKLCSLGYCVIFLSHSRVREERGRVVTTKKMVPTIPARAYGPVAAVCEVIGYYGFDDEDVEKDAGARWIYFQPTDVIDAKDWTGRLPRKLRARKGADVAGEIVAAISGAPAGGGRSPRATKKRSKRAARKG